MILYAGSGHHHVCYYSCTGKGVMHLMNTLSCLDMADYTHLYHIPRCIQLHLKEKSVIVAATIIIAITESTELKLTFC